MGRQSEEFYQKNKTLMYKCKCLEDLKNGEWKFKCENGHTYIENLKIALSDEEAAQLKIGSTFNIERLTIECSSTLVD